MSQINLSIEEKKTSRKRSISFRLSLLECKVDLQSSHSPTAYIDLSNLQESVDTSIRLIKIIRHRVNSSIKENVVLLSSFSSLCSKAARNCRWILSGNIKSSWNDRDAFANKFHRLTASWKQRKRPVECSTARFLLKPTDQRTISAQTLRFRNSFLTATSLFFLMTVNTDDHSSFEFVSPRFNDFIGFILNKTRFEVRRSIEFLCFHFLITCCTSIVVNRKFETNIVEILLEYCFQCLFDPTSTVSHR